MESMNELSHVDHDSTETFRHRLAQRRLRERRIGQIHLPLERDHALPVVVGDSHRQQPLVHLSFPENAHGTLLLEIA